MLQRFRLGSERDELFGTTARVPRRRHRDTVARFVDGLRHRLAGDLVCAIQTQLWTREHTEGFGRTSRFGTNKNISKFVIRRNFLPFQSVDMDFGSFGPLNFSFIWHGLFGFFFNAFERNFTTNILIS